MLNASFSVSTERYAGLKPTKTKSSWWVNSPNKVGYTVWYIQYAWLWFCLSIDNDRG